MAVSRAMRRLLRIRDLEEERHRVALESALGDLHILENALAQSHHRERRGREWVDESARTGEVAHPQGGLVETIAPRPPQHLPPPPIAAPHFPSAKFRTELLA